MKRISAATTIAALGSMLAAAQPVFAAERADTILLNGRIITVDQRFSVAEAIAIRGGRIAAVGKNADVLEHQGPGTKVIDLKKRTVIRGLIDNHAHFIRAPEHDELRLDGVSSRSRALAMLAERVRAARPGEWIATLGGWSEDQFTDDPRGFPRDELDRIAPANPVVLQAVYIHSYLNSAALKAAGIDAATPDPRGGAIEKDAAGNPTGVVRGAGGVAFVAAKIPLPDKEQWLANVRKYVAGLNAMGITAWYDAGGPGPGERPSPPPRQPAQRRRPNDAALLRTVRPRRARPGRPIAQVARGRRLGKAALRGRAGSRHVGGPGIGGHRRDDLQPVLYAVVRRDRTHDRRAQGEPADDQPRAGAGRAHAQQ